MESKLWYKQTNLKNRNGPTDKENRLFVASGVWGGGGLGVWNGSLGLADANRIYRMDRQQGPTVRNRELYSVSQWKRLRKKKYVYV